MTRREDKKKSAAEESGVEPGVDADMPAVDKDSSRALEEISEQMDDETADIVIQAIDELADRSAEIEKLKEDLDQVTDQWKRQAAEFQNYRRRTEQEKGQMVAFGKSMVIQQLLDVVDDFQRSLEATEQTEQNGGTVDGSAYESFKSGVVLVYQKLTDELKKMDVVPIEAVGKPFDEDLHEALMQQPAAEGQEPGVILSEIQRGYRMGDRVLRHSKVVVAS